MGNDVHVSTTARDIAVFLNPPASRHPTSHIVCFRCGEHGHTRSQCLTYKVRMCWHHMHRMCTDTYCTFAHGENELRQPWQLRCVRVVKQGDRYVSIGCNSAEHTFRKCPLYRENLLQLPP